VLFFEEFAARHRFHAALMLGLAHGGPYGYAAEQYYYQS
jgi:hypothetical protein